MQASDVRNSFLIETGMLAFFSALAGTAIAFAAMWGLSAITFKTEDNPLSMLLVSGHLFFAPTLIAVLGFILLIMAIAVLTAWFPARRAAKLSAAAALRHYE
jgi:ABC-type antimicrobial peptide transport system permease subunit